MDVFFDVATQISNQPIRECKAQGKKVIGYTCSYVPAEIFYAADILPVRLRGIETDGMEIADAYYGPFICSYPKCILQLAGKGVFGFLDGTVITPGCDAMRRLHECWRKAGEDYEGIVPPYYYYFDVPHKTEPHGMRWFEQEIRNLIKSIEQHFGVRITNDKLQAAICEYNKGRRLLQEVEDLRSQAAVKVSGVQVFAATVAGTVMPRDQFNGHLEKWLQSIKQNKPPDDKRKRLMLIGSISDEIDLVALIESNFDAVVVAENLCFGVRYEGSQIQESEDPIQAFAEHYLGQSVCPRMYGKYRERLALLKQKFEHAHADGVVMQNIRFCDLHAAENALFERDLEAIGVPCLRIEREYGPLTESGRMKMRINAFLERIS